MTIQFNHTIVHTRDSHASAAFLAGILGLSTPVRFGPFQVVQADNGVSLDFQETAAPVTPQHYAFLIGEADFDAVFARICERGLPFWAGPGKTRPGEINHGDGGRGVYFEDPDGHVLEVLTHPYGSGR